MKKLFTLLCIMTVGITVHSQSYTLLSNDPMGDATMSNVGDIKSISYRMDLVQDSLWFRIETFNPMDPNGDVGMIFGFDTNQVITDGLTWHGDNTSLNYDQALIIFQDVVFPNYYGYTYNSGGGAPIAVYVERPDSFTFLINVQLSALDPDGNFNLIYGTGAFDIVSNQDTYDDAPNTGFFSISPSTGIQSRNLNDQQLTLFPNPAPAYLTISTSKNSDFPDRFIIYSIHGKEMMRDNYKVGTQINLNKLMTGTYYIDFYKKNQKIQSSMFQKTSN